jgi:hypothetical protein
MSNVFGLFWRLALNTVVAVITPTLFESLIYSSHISPARRTGAGAVTELEWFFSIAFAGLLGIFFQRIWFHRVAIWTWIVPGLWFALGLVVYFSGLHHESVLESSPQRFGPIANFLGISCKNATSWRQCRDFFTFTVPLIRGLSYSLGAYVSSLVGSRPTP